MKEKDQINTKEKKGQSRILGWIKKLDEKDKSLSPMLRKSKWVSITAFLFFMFGLSFIWYPPVRLTSEELKKLGIPQENTYKKSPQATSFEMPVDSFENHLKRNIYEDLPEKE